MSVICQISIARFWSYDMVIFVCLQKVVGNTILNSCNDLVNIESCHAKLRITKVLDVVVVSHIQRIGCQPEKNYFTRWPIPLVVC